MDFLNVVQNAVDLEVGFKRPTGHCIIIVDKKENPNKFFRLRKIGKTETYVKENWHCTVGDILFNGWELVEIPEDFE